VGWLGVEVGEGMAQVNSWEVRYGRSESCPRVKA